jgi:hypothetical protein
MSRTFRGTCGGRFLSPRFLMFMMHVAMMSDMEFMVMIIVKKMPARKG